METLVGDPAVDRCWHYDYREFADALGLPIIRYQFLVRLHVAAVLVGCGFDCNGLGQPLSSVAAFEGEARTWRMAADDRFQLSITFTLCRLVYAHLWSIHTQGQ